MSTGKESATETIDWFVEPDQTGPSEGASEYSRVWRDEKRANSVGLIVTTSLLFALFAAALVVGGHAAIGPLLRRAIATRDAKGIGDVVYTMPDGVFCRHMSFNNATAEVSGAAIEPCRESIRAGREVTVSKFEWGGR